MIQFILAMKMRKEEKMNNLIPKINGEYVQQEGFFILPAVLTVPVCFPDTVQLFGERLKNIGAYQIQLCEMSPCLSYCEERNFAKEAYAVSITEDMITVKASGEHGFSNALVSLYQLLAKGNGKISCGSFFDEPRYEYRGFMLDCCRHFFPLEDVKRILEYVSLLKFNKFHWHLSEDQGFRIESKRFEELNTISSYRSLCEEDPMVTEGFSEAGKRYGGYYTQEEIADLIAYAAKRQIEVFPEIDLPGHSVATLAAFPQLSCSGKSADVENRFGIFERIFCAGKEETFTFLEDLLDEVCALFPSPYFHIGGDEVPKKAWMNCPDCNRVMKEQGFTDYEQLQAYFTKRMIQILEKNHKIPIVWNEAAASGDLDKRAILQYWYEDEEATYTLDEITKERKFILSNVQSFYCDYAYEHVTLQNTLLYEPQAKGKAIPQKNILGVEAPVWTEQIPTAAKMEKLINPRLLAAAENAWTQEREYDEFMVRMQQYQNCKILNYLEEYQPGEKIGVGYIFE